jgi:hypothetical protein
MPQTFTQTQPISDDAASNRIPVVSWNATNLTDILSGTNNSAITNAALAMAAFQGPILLRWAWEMNLAGTNGKAWAYLGYPTNGSDPSSAQVAAAQTNFVTAWRQIRKIFDANGAANVIWLWNPGADNDSAPGQSAGGYTDGFYPGDAYVDWIGIDAYNRQDDTFADTYTVEPSYGYTNMAAHAKPLLIGETGAYFTNEAHQITFFDAAAGSLQTNFPQLLGFMYFDASGNDDWSLTIAGATNGLTEFSNLVNSTYLNATVPHFLNYEQFHPFSARVHVAPAATIFQGGIIGVGASVDNLYSNLPTGRIDFYSDTNYLATVSALRGFEWLLPGANFRRRHERGHPLADGGLFRRRQQQRRAILAGASQRALAAVDFPKHPGHERDDGIGLEQRDQPIVSSPIQHESDQSGLEQSGNYGFRDQQHSGNERHFLRGRSVLSRGRISLKPAFAIWP